MNFSFSLIGGGKGGVFFVKRYAFGSGLNSSNLDFLPVHNIDEGEMDAIVGGVVGAVPIGKLIFRPMRTLCFFSTGFSLFSKPITRGSQ